MDETLSMALQRLLAQHGADTVRQALADAVVAQHGDDGLMIVSGHERVQDAPSTGWYLRYRPAVSDQGYELAFATEGAARARLTAMSIRHRRPIDGDFLDLTVPGCHDTVAFIGPY